MNEPGAKTVVLSLLDVTGLKKIMTSFSATLISFGVNDILQVVSVAVGIVAGLMAIRHYFVATKLNQAKLDKMNVKDNGVP